VFDGGEVLFEQGEQIAVRPARQHLGDKGAARSEILDRKPRRRLDQPHRAQVIGLLVADGVGRHVGQHQIGLAAQRIGERLRGRIGHEIHLEDRHALDRLDRQQVDPHHFGLG
jgi:hypothetical protein